MGEVVSVAGPRAAPSRTTRRPLLFSSFSSFFFFFLIPQNKNQQTNSASELRSSAASCEFAAPFPQCAVLPSATPAQPPAGRRGQVCGQHRGQLRGGTSGCAAGRGWVCERGGGGERKTSPPGWAGRVRFLLRRHRVPQVFRRFCVWEVRSGRTVVGVRSVINWSLSFYCCFGLRSFKQPKRKSLKTITRTSRLSSDISVQKSAIAESLATLLRKLMRVRDLLEQLLRRVLQN